MITCYDPIYYYVSKLELKLLIWHTNFPITESKYYVHFSLAFWLKNIAKVSLISYVTLITRCGIGPLEHNDREILEPFQLI